MGLLLEIKDLYKEFEVPGSRKRVHAINGVNLDIARGQTLALVGESGSGKTTVGRCVLGLETATSGEVIFRGEVLSKAHNIRSPRLRGVIQLVFQEPAEALDPRFRIFDTVEEPMRAVGMGERERDERISEVMGLVNLPMDTLGKYPSALSAGQQQRVGIARALATRPSLLVLDEPTSALDPSARAEIIELLTDIQRNTETSYLFISHDLTAVHRVSHRIAVMYLGKIVEEGPASEIFTTPRHPYSMGLLASVLLPDPRIKRTTNISLRGEIPSPISLPSGCFLATRCPFATDKCRTVPPEPDAVTESHFVYCHHHEEAAEADQPSDTFKEFQEAAEQVLLAADTKNNTRSLAQTQKAESF